MRRWGRQRLEQLAEVTKGRLLPTSDEAIESTVRYLGAADLEGSEAGSYASAKNAVLCDPDDVLMLWDGERSGLVGCGLSGAASSTVARIRPVNGKVTSRYLYHHLRSRFSEIQSLRTGTGVPHVPRDLQALVQVPVPPVEEQRRIAEVLDSVDDAIRATERVIAKLDDLGSAFLTQLVRQCADNGTPVPLNSTGVWLSGGTPNTNEPSFWDGPIPWITASNLRSKFLSRSSRTLTAAGVRAGSRLVPRGTLICVVRGMSLKSEFRVGIAAVELAFGQDCKALSPTDDWLPEYVHLQLAARESEVLRLVDEASHGTGRLQMPLLGALLVDRISLAEQQRVVALYRAHEDRVSAEEAELAKLRQLRAGLAEDLLSGRVRTVAA